MRVRRPAKIIAFVHHFLFPPNLKFVALDESFFSFRNCDGKISQFVANVFHDLTTEMKKICWEKNRKAWNMFRQR